MSSESKSAGKGAAKGKTANSKGKKEDAEKDFLEFAEGLPEYFRVGGLKNKMHNNNHCPTVLSSYHKHGDNIEVIATTKSEYDNHLKDQCKSCEKNLKMDAEEQN